MSDIIQFPLEMAQGGSIVCWHNGVRFPAIYRIQQVVTPEVAAEFGINITSDDTQVYHSFDNDTSKYPGFVTFKEIKKLREDDKFSLIVRHHLDADRAFEYLQGIADRGGERCMDMMQQTDQGFFT